MDTQVLQDSAEGLCASASVLEGDVTAPGDKSMSHRALILGALAEGESWIEGLLDADDVRRTVVALRAFGAEVRRRDDGRWRVRGTAWRSPAGPIDCGNSGTAARLLMGAAAGFPLQALFTGDTSLGRRPMERVLEPLREMGAQAEGETLPVTIRGGNLRGIRFTNATASAQVKSAVLLAGLRAQGAVEVLETAPTRDHSESMLRAFGCDVESTAHGVRLGARRWLTATEIWIPGDPSSAAYPLVAGLVAAGSHVRVRSVMINPLRSGLFECLDAMGADLRIENRRVKDGETVADITAQTSRLCGIEVPAERAPSMIDEYPILAVAAAFAEGRTVMHGVGELRVKESNRMRTVVAGLGACGVTAFEDGNSLVIEGAGRPRGGTEVAAHDDHRIAMSFLVMGLASAEPVAVDCGAMIATSFPGFVPLMRSLGGAIG